MHWLFRCASGVLAFGRKSQDEDVKFQRGDVVEFEVYRDESRGEKSQSRARNMLLVRLQSSGDSKEQCGKSGKPKNNPYNLGMSLYCQRECILLF